MRLPLAFVVLSAAGLASGMDDSTIHSEYLGGYRFGVGVAPGVNNHKASDSKDANGLPDPTQDGEVSLSAKTGLDLYGGMFFNNSLNGGFGVSVVPTIFYKDVRGRGTKAGVTTSDELKAWGGRLAIGPAFTAGPLALEVTPFIGVGSAWMQTETSVGGVSVRRGSGSNVLLDYGVSGTAYWLFESALCLGLSVGYEGFRTKLDSAASGALDSQKITVKGSGLMANVFFGFWF